MQDQVFFEDNLMKDVKKSSTINASQIAHVTLRIIDDFVTYSLFKMKYVLSTSKQ